MWELLYDQVMETVQDLGIGAAVWLVALWFPFRALRGGRELAWDVLGYIGSAAAGVIVVAYLEEPFLDNAAGYFHGWLSWYQTLPWWMALTGYLLSSELGTYWAHRLLHSKLLWDSHAWHHSPRYLYFLSGTRAAPIHVLVLTAPTTLAFLFFPDPDAYYVALAHSAFQIANQHYLHSNLRAPFSRYLEYVLVTPRVHFVHHSRNRKYSDSNYGFIFTFWDRLFGTYTDPDTVPADEPLGLNYEISNVRAFFGLPPRRQTSSGGARELA